jgi:APA family basic amino acid/polyamine antiporter
METGTPDLLRRLGPVQLVLIGIGVIVGGGIFVVTGTAAAQYAGPAVILSFVLAALGCGLAGLCYAELAAALPLAGGGYSYTRFVFGDVLAWFVGWNLLMEYVCAGSYIAVGWSGYVTSLLTALGANLPALLTQPPIAIGADGFALTGALWNLPAALVALAALAIVLRGIALSAAVNAVLVAMKLSVLTLFLLCGAFYIDPANWVPFLPANTGQFGSFGVSGVLRAAAVVFVAFLGFDAVATLAQETRNPQRNVPIGMLGSLAICTLLYIAVAIVLTGLAPYRALDVANPLSAALRSVGGALDWLAPLVEIVAMSGLASVLLIVITAPARVCLAMAQDGLLPARFARVHPRFHTPHVASMLIGGAIAALASLFPVAALTQLVSMGTLCVFLAVCAGVLRLRRTQPDLPRPFRVPFGPVIPLLGIAVCLYMLTGLPRAAWLLFCVWSAAGAIFYLAYGRRRAGENACSAA